MLGVCCLWGVEIRDRVRFEGLICLGGGLIGVVRLVCLGN